MSSKCNLYALNIRCRDKSDRYNGTWLDLLISSLCRINVSVNQVNIGSDNGLSPIRRQAIIGTSAGLLLINWTLMVKLQWNFNQNTIFSFTKMHLKISSVKWRPFCPGGWVYSAHRVVYLTALNWYYLYILMAAGKLAWMVYWAWFANCWLLLIFFKCQALLILQWRHMNIILSYIIGKSIVYSTTY